MSKLCFSRGYKEIKEKVEKTAKYTRSCENCTFYYKTDEDDEELCQNPNVLAYDICVEENRTYCSFWKYTKRGNKNNG